MGMKKVKVFLTGATGVMGMAALRCLTESGDRYEVTVLARPGKRNVRKLAGYVRKGVKVVWGDLLNPSDVLRGVEGADIVLHAGGMVSPEADRHPAMTYKVNTESIRNIVGAVKISGGKDKTKVVYVGSVAQYGSYLPPDCWGGVGDPLVPAAYDAYALSKIEGERILAESGLRYWVSLRQTSILHKGLLMKAGNPVMFHVPLRGVLEWITDEDSGRLLERVCSPEVPDSFWRNFYNVGGGADFRMTNYEFETRLLKAIGVPAPEKIFESNWFATRNFHGMWFSDSDELERLLHFRSGESADECFKRMVKESPLYLRLSPLAPAFLIKMMMRRVANAPVLGPMWWIEHGEKGRIDAAFGSLEEWKKIPGWKAMDLTSPDKTPPKRPKLPGITPETVYAAAAERGGECMNGGNAIHGAQEADCGANDPAYIDTPVELRCSYCHHFRLTPRALVRGGHWCPECMRRMSKIDSIMDVAAMK